MTAEMDAHVRTGTPTVELPWRPILLYHRIVPEIVSADAYRLCVTVSDFEAQMRYLKDHSYQSVSIEELACTEAPLDGARTRQVAITFDDGYHDFYKYALPVLQKLQMTATVFVVSSLIGGTNEWDRGKVEEVPLMSLAELKDIQGAGISIGSHGIRHRHLGKMSTDDAWEELTASKAALEDTLQQRIRVFSFPHGSASSAVEEMARRAGYVAACGIERPHNRPFHLSRIDAVTCDGAGLLWRWKVSGRYFHLRRNRVVGLLRGSPNRRAVNAMAKAPVMPTTLSERR